MKMRSAFAVSGLAVTLVVFGACGESDSKNVGAADAPGAPATTSDPAETYRIGDTVKLGDAEVTVHGITDPFDAGIQAVKAPAGSRHVAVDAEVKNLSKEPRTFSSFAQFEMKDPTNKSCSPIPLPARFPAIGGRAEPGTARRGIVAFEIPEGSTGLQVVFNNRLSAAGSVPFNLG